MSNGLIAQNNQITAYSLEEGLPQSQIYEIVQDDRGYIWLGTQGGGIAKFDGKEFKVWNEKSGLISNYIHSISFMNDSLFIGTKYGLSIKVKDQFLNYASPQINTILKTGNRVILGTSKGLYTFNQQQKITRLPINLELDAAVINHIYFNNNQYWIATNKGLWKLSSNFESPVKLSDFNISSVVFDEKVALAASFNQGIYTIDSTNKHLTKISETQRINSINIFNGEELWVATETDGIHILNIEDYALISKINKESGLSIPHIRKCLKDIQNNVWAATSGGGLFKISENNFKHYDKDTGLKGNRIYAINEINKAIWFSNSEEGLMKIDSLGIHAIDQDAGYLNVKIKTIANDTEGNVYTGTDGKGIMVLHNSVKDSLIVLKHEETVIFKDTMAFSRAFTDTLNIEKGFPFNWIRKIHIQDSKIWVASYSKGIAEFEYDTENQDIKAEVKTYNETNGISDLLINDIRTDYEGKLWYATSNGALGYIEEGKVSHLGKVLEENTSIRTLLFHENRIFIGTSGKGIWWSDFSEPIKFQRLIGQKELYSDNIYQLIFDDASNLWAGSENGIDKIVLSKNLDIVDVVHYGRNDGFWGIETCLNSVVKDQSGNLWFGAINGLTKYQPTDRVKEKIKPSIFFEEITSMNNRIPSKWYSSVDSTAIFKLKSHQNLLTFGYKTVDINHPNEIKYRWKLDNSDWSSWSSDTHINIASDYGNHSFSVQSRNPGWQTSEILSFPFFIETPLLKKLWFQWMIYIMISSIVVIIGRGYFKRLKTKSSREKKELQLQNHLLSLEQKALQLQMNPHFIFNVLNGIKAMSISNSVGMNETINKFASLLRNTLNNSRENSITLEQEISTLKNYIEVEQLMSEKPISYRLNIGENLIPEEVLIPPMLIQPFVENAIRHGIMAVKRAGELTISFDISDDFLLCEIIDNGIGIKQAQQVRPKNSHKSMAMKVTEDRIRYLAGQNTLIITEIQDSNQKPKGTKISFKIPIETDF
jgi:ligand-binding sensor domain-containing protein